MGGPPMHSAALLRASVSLWPSQHFSPEANHDCQSLNISQKNFNFLLNIPAPPAYYISKGGNPLRRPAGKPIPRPGIATSKEAPCTLAFHVPPNVAPSRDRAQKPCQRKSLPVKHLRRANVAKCPKMSHISK